MNLHEIQEIQGYKLYPSVTITMPTHRTSPANKQDTIRLKNLAQQAADQLLKEFKRREVQGLLDKLDQMVQGVDHRYNLDGLKLFLSAEYAAIFNLPFSLNERVVIQDSFFTRDLVYAMNRTPRYWVLSLSEKPTRLYEATLDLLVEVKGEGFPMEHTGAGGATSLPGGFGVNKSAYRDERHRQFFRKVDAAFRPFHLDDPLPLAVVGVDRFQSFFKEVSAHSDRIITTILGSHDKSSPSNLAKLVWPPVKEKLAEERKLVLDELAKAVGERRSSSTIGEVWRQAHQGRGLKLVVEEDFHYTARLDDKGNLHPAQDPTAEGVIPDAVDEIIETVLRKGGTVVFEDNGTLEKHGRIALILRW